MGKDEGREFLFIGEKMTAMDVRDGDLVLSPLGFAGGGERKKTVNHGRKSSGGPYNFGHGRKSGGPYNFGHGRKV